MDTRPHLFQPGSLFDVSTYDRILSSVMEERATKSKDTDIDEHEQYDDSVEHHPNSETFDHMYINHQRSQELQHLSRVIHNEQPMDDDMADIVVQQLNEILDEIEDMDDDATENEQETSAMISNTHPYPPINQTGLVADHDRPHADYGHLGALELDDLGQVFLVHLYRCKHDRQRVQF